MTASTPDEAAARTEIMARLREMSVQPGDPSPVDARRCYCNELRSRLAAQQPVIDAAQTWERQRYSRGPWPEGTERWPQVEKRLRDAVRANRATLSGSVEAADTPPSGTSGHEADTPAEPEPYVLCGDCRHCHPELYDGDDECGPECHPGLVCVEKHDFREVAGTPAAEPAPDDRDRLIEVIEAAMPGETVWTRSYGDVQIAPDTGDLADALIAAGYERGTPRPFIDVVFDGPPSHEAGRFVEVEDPDGRGFNAGEWIDRGNGMWALRIATEGRAVKPAAASAVEAVDLIATALDEDIAEWVELRVGPAGFEADPSALARIAVEALTARPDVLRALAGAGAPTEPADDRPTRLVAEKDGKPGCPAEVWDDGIYRNRCSRGIDECGRHGKFAVRPADDTQETT